MKTEFRNATADDCALILEFIKGLAEYEKMSDDVVATEDLLREWIFEKQKAEVIFALEDGREIGFALFFIAVGMIVSMFLSSTFVQVLMILIFLLLGYNLFCY
jgi:hypothetical protein